MSRRRRGRRGGAGGGGRWTALVVLLLAGAGIWVGAGIVDSDGHVPLLSPESGAPGPGTDGEAGPEVAPGDEDGGARPAIPGSGGERVRVEVLNAGGVRGVASRARDELRDHGFDVVYYGNAPAFGEEHSTVVGRVERSAETDRMVREVARSLGIGDVRFDPDPGRHVEVSVHLGRSWQTAEEREGGTEDGDEAAPRDDADTGSARWNPLRWLRGGGG